MGGELQGSHRRIWPRQCSPGGPSEAPQPVRPPCPERRRSLSHAPVLRKALAKQGPATGGWAFLMANGGKHCFSYRSVDLYWRGNATSSRKERGAKRNPANVSFPGIQRTKGLEAERQRDILGLCPIWSLLHFPKTPLLKDWAQKSPQFQPCYWLCVCSPVPSQRTRWSYCLWSLRRVGSAQEEAPRQSFQ